MKWGVRKGRRTTGVSRSRGAILDRNARFESAIKKARTGAGYQRSAALGKKLVGEQQQKENWKRMLKDIKNQNERIRSGQLTVADKMDIWGNVSLFDLAVTRQPRT